MIPGEAIPGGAKSGAVSYGYQDQKTLVDEMLEEEEKKLKKFKPLWKVSRLI